MSFGVLTAIGTPIDTHLKDQAARLGTDELPYVRAVPLHGLFACQALWLSLSLSAANRPFRPRVIALRAPQSCELNPGVCSRLDAQILSGCDAFLRTALATPGLFRQDAEAAEMLAVLRHQIEIAQGRAPADSPVAS